MTKQFNVYHGYAVGGLLDGRFIKSNSPCHTVKIRQRIIGTPGDGKRFVTEESEYEVSYQYQKRVNAPDLFIHIE